MVQSPAQDITKSSVPTGKIYVHHSLKIEDPRNTPIKKESNEDRIKVLIVPDQGYQKLNIFNLPKNTECMVNDFLNQLTIGSNEEIDSTYLVNDPIYDVRYVVLVRSKLPCHKEKSNGSSNKSYRGTVNLIKDKTSVTTSLKKNETDIISQILSDTRRLTFYLRRNTQILVKYPLTPSKGGITVTIEDFKCLDENQYLNDIIIDFYLKYVTSETLSPEKQERIYVFNTYFYTRLSRPRCATIDTNDVSLAALQHAEVKRWTKNVNIFQKDFVFIPIHQSAHWFLAVIVYPGLIVKENTDATSKVTNQLHYPCILIFDSLSSTVIQYRQIVRDLRNYLGCEYAAKIDEQYVFWEDDLAIDYLDVPQQDNSSDCGLYLLQYVECFLKDFVANNGLQSPMKSLNDWFKAEIIQRKRKELKQLLIKLNIDSKRIKENLV